MNRVMARRVYQRGVNTPQSMSMPAPISSKVMARAVATLNESVAPVCPITRSEVPPAQPGIKIPSIPRATDLDSAIKAINAIAALLNDNNSGPFIRWLEQYRVTQIVRITNPDDDSQWVDVERITKLVMEDQENGDLWVWELDHTPPAPPAPARPLIFMTASDYNSAKAKWDVILQQEAAGVDVAASATQDPVTGRWTV